MYFHFIVHFLWKAKFSESKLSVKDLKKGKAMGTNRFRGEIYLVAIFQGRCCGRLSGWKFPSISPNSAGRGV